MNQQLQKYLVVLIFIILITLSSSIYAKEITLFNSKGGSVAYIDTNDDLTIYLWSGKPVAYLNSNSIYGFNGKHLGWFHKGIIWDHDGNAVGFIENAVIMPTKLEPLKGLQKLTPLKSITEIPPIEPIYSRRWSHTPLSIFLSQGIK